MLTYEPEKGMSIYLAAMQAVNIASARHEDVQFKFNGVDLIVSKRSFADDIAMIYTLKCEIRRLRK